MAEREDQGIQTNRPAQADSRIQAESPLPEPLRMAEELASVPFEPLLPAEKKLIGWSLSLGVGLLVLLWWLVV